jgi:TldD protein
MTPTTSLLDRANLDRDSVCREVARGLEAPTTASCSWNTVSPKLMFDNGRLSSYLRHRAGFGLRAVFVLKDDGRLCAFL